MSTYRIVRLNFELKKKESIIHLTLTESKLFLEVLVDITGIYILFINKIQLGKMKNYIFHLNQ